MADCAPHDPELKECKAGISDSGKNILGAILNLAALGVAGINTAAAIDMATQQYEIADDYYDIAKWWRDYYYNAYAPVENQELWEAQSLPIEEPLYDMAVGRAKTRARLQFKGMATKAMQCTSEYCTGLRQAFLRDMVIAEATAVAASAALGYRNERAYVTARNDVRWKRQFETVQRGRGFVANNVQYANLAFGIFGDLGKQAGAGAAGAIKYLG